MACIGIGVDIVEISRVSLTIKIFGDAFFKRVFSTQENIKIARLLEKFGKDSDALSSFCAKRFAAKEAFIKSIGKSFLVSMKEISSENNDFGKPCIVLYGKTLNRFISFIGDKKGCEIFLSLADDGGMAIASVYIGL